MSLTTWACDCKECRLVDRYWLYVDRWLDPLEAWIRKGSASTGPFDITEYVRGLPELVLNKAYLLEMSTLHAQNAWGEVIAFRRKVGQHWHLHVFSEKDSKWSDKVCSIREAVNAIAAYPRHKIDTKVITQRVKDSY